MSTKEESFDDGIKEKLDEIATIDLLYNYGSLIAKDLADFNSEWLKDSTILLKKVPEVGKNFKKDKNLNW